MEVAGDFCASKAVALRQMAASLVEAVAVEAVLVVQKSVYLLLAMGSLLNGRSLLNLESENRHGFDGSIIIEMNEKNTGHVGDGVDPENKDDGDSDNDEDDEDGEEQDDDGDGDDDDASEDEDNQGDEDQEDDVEANGGGSDEEEEDEEEDEDDDEEDDDGEDEDEEDEEDEEKDEMPEPPIKKRK